MLRRVAWVFRVLLFGGGIACAFLLAVSSVGASIRVSVSGRYMLQISDHAAWVVVFSPALSSPLHDFYFNPVPGSSLLPRKAQQQYGAGVITLYSMPLWLLALLCLAWPVTSFIIARRRRKGRGFEVEAKPGAAASTEG